MFDLLAKRLLSPINTSIVAILGLGMSLIGIWMILPFDSLHHARIVVGEGLLGFAMAITGMAIVYSSIKSEFNIMKAATATSFVLWLIVAVAFMVTRIEGISWITSLIFAVYSGCIYVNLRVNIP